MTARGLDGISIGIVGGVGGLSAAAHPAADARAEVTPSSAGNASAGSPPETPVRCLAEESERLGPFGGGR